MIYEFMTYDDLCMYELRYDGLWLISPQWDGNSPDGSIHLGAGQLRQFINTDRT